MHAVSALQAAAFSFRETHLKSFLTQTVDWWSPQTGATEGEMLDERDSER